MDWKKAPPEESHKGCTNRWESGSRETRRSPSPPAFIPYFYLSVELSPSLPPSHKGILDSVEAPKMILWNPQVSKCWRRQWGPGTLLSLVTFNISLHQNIKCRLIYYSAYFPSCISPAVNSCKPAAVSWASFPMKSEDTDGAADKWKDRQPPVPLPDWQSYCQVSDMTPCIMRNLQSLFLNRLLG